MTVRYITWFGGPMGQPSPKVFERREDAQEYAQHVSAGIHQADIYEVAIPPHVPHGREARAALAGLQMGEGRFIEARGGRGA